jgi:hypothetical protein
MKPGSAVSSIVLVLVALASWAQAETVSPATDRSASPPLHPIVIENPPTLGKLTTGLRDAAGRPIGIECATCHASNLGTAMAALADAPDGFHAGIKLVHGALVCDSCHAPDDRTRLRLASGQILEMGEVITLCAQCHSSQFRSYQHMAHGGSRGYWDRTKGPVIRNSCVACHAAHAPAYPLVRPVAPTNDRFLPRPAAHQSAVIRVRSSEQAPDEDHTEEHEPAR